jgi:hypothetical protein
MLGAMKLSLMTIFSNGRGCSCSYELSLYDLSCLIFPAHLSSISYIAKNKNITYLIIDLCFDGSYKLCILMCDESLAGHQIDVVADP